MPTLTVLVGLPGSGKSTSIPEHFDGFVYSTDRYIEQCAKQNGWTYDQAFKEFINSATKYMNEQLNLAIHSNTDIIWDQTNLGDNKRRSILFKIPKHYHKICICRVLPRTETEWSDLNQRLLQREGKTIPSYIINTMKLSYIEPSVAEGFDEVYLHDIYGNQL